MTLPPPSPPPPSQVPPPPSPMAPPFVGGPGAVGRPAPGLATAALVCGIVGLVLVFIGVPSIVALVLGLIAWNRGRAAPGPGDRRGQALAGWILGLVGVLGFAAFVVAAILTSDDDASASINDVRIGQCLNVDFDADELSSVQPRECARPHDAEVYVVRRIDGVDEFPGQRELDRRGQAACGDEALQRYVGARSEDGTLSSVYVVPSEATWLDGDRTIVCLVTRADDGKLTGSVEDPSG